MTVRIYRDTDAGAPVLSGAAGTLIGVLDACLVNGYGAQAPAGWTKPFAGANKAVYRQPKGFGRYFRFKDDGADPIRGNFALVTGYESMTDVDTGTGPFPTADTYRMGKTSTDGDPGPMKWIVAADERTAYIFVRFFNGGVLPWNDGMIGDIFSFKRDDAYRAGVFVSHWGDVLIHSGTRVDQAPGFNGVKDVIALARDRRGALGALFTDGDTINPPTRQQLGQYGDVSKRKVGDPVAKGRGSLPFPNLVAGLSIARVHISEISGPAVRGHHRGVWHWLHDDAAVAHGDTFPGAGTLLGKSFEIIKPLSSGAVDGVGVLETSDTWPANVDGI